MQDILDSAERFNNAYWILMFMKKNKLTSGFEIPSLGIGTYGFGGEHEPDYSSDDKCISAIRSALDLGYTHIDTAEVYGGGHTEELVGRAIEGYDRSKLFITTKVFKTNLNHDNVIRSAKASISRMKISYIDLYLVHSPNKDIPIEETMKALNKLVEAGLVKNIGVCNFSAEELEEAQRFSRHKIVANQMKLSLWAEKKPDIDTIRYCQDNDITVVAYKVFGRGKIETKKIPLIESLAKKYKKTMEQIVLNWVISKRNVVAIFASKDPKHLRDNIYSAEFEMTGQDHEKLDSLMHK